MMEKKLLTAKFDSMKWERDTLAFSSEQLALEVQCMPRLADEAKKVFVNVAELENATRSKVSL